MSRLLLELQTGEQFDSVRLMLEAPAGRIELLVDSPADAPCGLALVAHPQPLLGGSARHKIPHLLARAARDLGWLSLRPNFRGVGKSDGQHDHGYAETEDLLAVIAQVRDSYPTLPLALIGFSFGSFVMSRVAKRLSDSGAAAGRIVLFSLPVGEVDGKRSYPTESVPPGTLVVHGEMDESVPLGSILQWARPQTLPVVVVPGADHFFAGHLPVLRSLFVSYLMQPS
ncbi:alpha/beta hydrolase [Variovorax sp. AFSI2.2]|uniref:alpha/beta hydrolase n=1 Tax=Variovorax sp. AFSI2.2 TaxID=3384160 RepID=UPI003EB97E53